MPSWFSSCRVAPDEVGQRLQRYERYLISLIGLREGLGVPIPDTLVLRKGCGSAYRCDPSTTVVIRNAVLSLRHATETMFSLSAEEDANSIVASWMCERRDMRGSLWSIEYFTREGLATFVAANGSLMTGILQRFVPARLHMGVNEVNQSLVGYFNFIEDTLAVERRYLRDCFINSTRHPTMRASLYPAVSVEGKVDFSKSLPFAPRDLFDVLAERVEPSAARATALIASVMDRVAAALEHSRAERCGCSVHDVRPVGYMVAEFRFSSIDDRLYLINMVQVRHQGDAMAPNSGFEIARLTPTYDQMCRTQSVGEDEFRVIEDQLAWCDRTFQETDWVASDIAFSGFNEVAPMMDRSPLKTRVQPSDLFACPNCDHLCHGEDLSPVPVSFMISQFREAHARGAAQRQQHSHAAPCVGSVGSGMANGYWASPPAVLQRLNVGIEEMAASPAWQSRTINICCDCQHSMGYSAPHEDSTPSRPKLSSLPMPPTCLRSDVIDSFVTTELQARHRAIRRVEREKYVSTLRVAQGVPPRIGHPRPPAQPSSAPILSREAVGATLPHGNGICGQGYPQSLSSVPASLQELLDAAGTSDVCASDDGGVMGGAPRPIAVDPSPLVSMLRRRILVDW